MRVSWRSGLSRKGVPTSSVSIFFFPIGGCLIINLSLSHQMIPGIIFFFWFEGAKKKCSCSRMGLARDLFLDPVEWRGRRLHRKKASTPDPWPRVGRWRRWQRVFSLFYPEFEDDYSILKFYGDTSTRRGSTKMWKELAKLHQKIIGKFVHASILLVKSH